MYKAGLQVTTYNKRKESVITVSTNETYLKSILLLDSRICREADERRSMRIYKYYAYIVSNLQ